MASVDLPPFLRQKQKEIIQKQQSGELPPFIKKKDEEGESSVSSTSSQDTLDPFSLRGIAANAAQSSAKNLLPEVSTIFDYWNEEMKSGDKTRIDNVKKEVATYHAKANPAVLTTSDRGEIERLTGVTEPAQQLEVLRARVGGVNQQGEVSFGLINPALGVDVTKLPQGDTGKMGLYADKLEYFLNNKKNTQWSNKKVLSIGGKETTELEDFLNILTPMSKESITSIANRFNSEQLNDSFSTGLESIKNTREKDYNRIKKTILSGQPVPTTDIVEMTSLGAKIIDDNNSQDVIDGRITPDQYTENQNALSKEVSENVYKHPDYLRSLISGIIGDYYEEKDRHPLSFVRSKWMITDKEIDAVPLNKFTQYGLDPNNPEFRKQLSFIKEKEGWMPFQNAIAKDDLFREFKKGALSVPKGIVSTAEAVLTPDDVLMTDKETAPFNVSEMANRRGKYFEENYGTWADAFQGLGQFSTQLALMYAGSSAVAATGEALGGGTTASYLLNATRAQRLGNLLINSKDLYATYGVPFVTTYGDYYKDAVSKGANPLQAKMMAFTNASMEGVSETIFDNLAFGRQVAKNLFAKQNYDKIAKIFDRGVLDEASEAAYKENLQEVISNTAKTFGRAALGATQESFEEVPVALTNFIVDAAANPSNVEGRNVFVEMKDAFLDGLVSFSIPSLIGLGGNLRKQFTEQKPAQESLMIAAMQQPFVTEAINNLVSKGELTQEQANQKIQVLNTAAAQLQELPKNYADGTELSPQDREAYLSLSVKEKYLDEIAKKGDGAQQNIAKPQIEEVTKLKEDILNKKPLVEESKEPDNLSEVKSAINNLPEGIYADVLKEAAKEESPERLTRMLKEVAQQMNSSENEAANTRRVFGDVADMAQKLYPEQKVGDSTQDIPAKSEEESKKEAGKLISIKTGKETKSLDEVMEELDNEANRRKGLTDEEKRREVDVKDAAGAIKDKLQQMAVLEIRMSLGGSGATPETIKRFQDILTNEINDIYDKYPELGKSPISRESVLSVIKQTPKEQSEWPKTPVQTFADRVIAGEKMSEQDRQYYEQNAAAVDTEIQSRDQKVRVPAERAEGLPSKPPISEPPKGSRIFVERPATELSYRGLQVVANEFSLPNVEGRDKKTDLELFRDAETKVNDWAEKGEYAKNIEALVQKAERGEILTDEERVILEQHLANISNELRTMTNVKSPEYDAKLGEILRLKNAGERTRGEAGAALRIPTYHARPKTIVDAMVEEMDVNSVTVLTDAQKEKVQKEWDALEKAKNDFNKYVFEKEAELSAKSAAAKFEEERKATATVKKPKKSKEEFGAEVDDILKSIRDKWKKAAESDVLTAVPLPYAKQLVAIAPDVLKLMKAYAAQAGSKFVDFVDDIHSYLQQDIPEITKEDIIDIARGVYNEKRPTRNQLAEKIQDWRTEASLIDKLDKLEQGEEPKTEEKKIRRNKEIAELREQIKGHDLTKLADAKESLKKRIDKTQEQLDKGEYAPPEKKEPIELDKEGKELQDKLIKLQYERQLRLIIQQSKNMSAREKAIKHTADILNIPRTLMTIGDFSAVLRQGIIPAISHPMMALDAAKKMFQATVSQKEYDRWFYNLQENPRYDIMRESDLAIADNLSHELSAREEGFMSSLAEKIPVVGSTIVKGSERAYTMFLNKMRVDLFNRFADSMEARGVTFRNNPEAYKQMADYVNNATGRGSLGYSLNKIAPLLNALFFSPRLIASRLNMLTYLAQPRFYTKVPREVREAYFKDMAKFIGVGMTILALSSLGGGDDDEVEADPRSSDFGKIKRGNTRWDIWGGFQPYVRVAAQVLTGERKSASTGKIYELGPDQPFGETQFDVLVNFGRSKLSPVAGALIDISSGRNLIGEKIVYDSNAGKKEITIGDYIKEHMLPLSYTGTQEAVKDQGIQAIFTVGVPSLFGVGTQTYKR